MKTTLAILAAVSLTWTFLFDESQQRPRGGHEFSVPTTTLNEPGCSSNCEYSATHVDTLQPGEELEVAFLSPTWPYLSSFIWAVAESVTIVEHPGQCIQDPCVQNSRCGVEASIDLKFVHPPAPRWKNYVRVTSTNGGETLLIDPGKIYRLHASSYGNCVGPNVKYVCEIEARIGFTFLSDLDLVDIEFVCATCDD